MTPKARTERRKSDLPRTSEEALVYAAGILREEAYAQQRDGGEYPPYFALMINEVADLLDAYDPSS